MKETVLQVDSLTKSHENHIAADGISFDLPARELGRKNVRRNATAAV